MSGNKQAGGKKGQPMMRASDRRLLRWFRSEERKKTNEELLKKMEHENEEMVKKMEQGAKVPTRTPPVSIEAKQLSEHSEEEEDEEDEEEVRAEQTDPSENSDSKSESLEPAAESASESIEEPSEPAPKRRKSRESSESITLGRMLTETGKSRKLKVVAKPKGPRIPTYRQPVRDSCATELEAELCVRPEYQYQPNEPLLMPHPRRWIVCQKCSQPMRSDQIGGTQITLGVVAYFHIGCL